ncbi:RNA polymerase sigma factor [Thermoanaerobacterium sp. DL9XJH110]|uniref:RNA polymerase sigma factor n=1 Tax=Thermoanaerobacterium sp. DL9XJH110 TaxID=3386643 RepID=UPI003BB6BE76
MITLNDSIAEDAVQEAFIAAFNNFDKLRDIKKFHAWLAVIASNKAIDMIRKNSRIYPSDQRDIFNYKKIPPVCNKKRRLQDVRQVTA